MKKLTSNAISAIQLDTTTKKISFVIRDGDTIYIVSGANLATRTMTSSEMKNGDHTPDK